MDIKALQQMLQEAKAYLDCSQLTRDEYIKRLGDTREHLKELLPAGMVLLHDPHTGLTMLALGDETLAWQNTQHYLEEQERYQDPHALERSLEKEYRRRVEDYQHPPQVGLWRHRVTMGTSTEPIGYPVENNEIRPVKWSSQ